MSKLRSSISTRELVAAGQVRGINPLIEIGVKGDAGPRKIEAAADALAARVVENVSVYVADKVELLEQQVAVSDAAARRGRSAHPGLPSASRTRSSRISRSRSTSGCS